MISDCQEEDAAHVCGPCFDCSVLQKLSGFIGEADRQAMRVYERASQGSHISPTWRNKKGLQDLFKISITPYFYWRHQGEFEHPTCGFEIRRLEALGGPELSHIVRVLFPGAPGLR